jgi:hypothetical protein
VNAAEAALVVALASAGFTASGLVWQFWLYRLSGPRLVVRLIPAVVDGMGTILRADDRGFDERMPSEMQQVLIGWTIDLAEVRVTNIGRMPVSVSEIGLDVGRVGPPLRRQRHTLRGFPIAIHGGVTDEIVRLESGGSTRLLLDLWPLVENLRRRQEGNITLRASAQAAGRHAKRSPWRKRWVLAPGRRSFRQDVDVTPEDRAYQALWRSLARTPEKLGDVLLVWNLIRGSVREDADPKEISGKLEPVLGSSQILLAHNVIEAFEGERQRPKDRHDVRSTE